MTPHNHLVVLNYILNECSLTAYDSQLEKVSWLHCILYDILETGFKRTHDMA